MSLYPKFISHNQLPYFYGTIEPIFFTQDHFAIQHMNSILPKFPKYLNESRDLKVNECQSNLYVMLKQLLFFISFTTSFEDGIL